MSNSKNTIPEPPIGKGMFDTNPIMTPQPAFLPGSSQFGSYTTPRPDLTPEETSSQSSSEGRKDKGKKKAAMDADQHSEHGEPIEHTGPSTGNTLTIEDLKNLKIHLTQPMPIAGTPTAPYFDGIDVSKYFKILERYFTNYRVTEERAKKD